ncbi:MAG: hypothetical protein L3K00_07160 [Thermoplasmata archaeon]|nr:hypothetical protein [Thermoplasmata archaeon]
MTGRRPSPNLGRNFGRTSPTTLGGTRATQTSTLRRPGGRSSALWSLAVVLGLLVSGAVTTIAGSGAALASGPSSPGATATVGNALLVQAHASASRGNGPGAAALPASPAGPSTGPNETMGMAMTYDAADGYVLAVSLNASSGLNNSTYGPNEMTWKFAAGNWSLIATTGQVPATLGPGLVYDVRDGYVLLYGGRLMATLPAPLTNQTWSYLGGTWTNLSRNGTTVPTAVDLPNLVFDAYDDYVLLYDEFGLSASPNGSLWTTWSYAAGNWTNLTATAGPAPPSFFGSMAYDARDQCVLYFGGETLSDELTNATWTFHGGAWTNVTSSVVNAPSGRIAFGLTYDTVRHEVLLYGGLVQLYVSNLSEYGTDTWSYANGTWTLLSTNGSVYNPQGWNPPQLDMVYDPADNETVLFGANLTASSPTAVTWTFSSSTWTVAAPAFVPTGHVTDTDRAVTLEVTQSVNAGGLSYAYSGLPPGCLSQDVASLPCAPTSVGTFHVQVTIDGDGGFAATAATTLVVHAAPAILGFAPSASTGEVGLPLGFTVTAVNGTGPLVYGYSNLPPGCRSSDAASLGCIPTSAGVYPVTATVTDTLGVIVVADSLLTVVPSLAITSVVAEHSAIDLGQALALATSVNGGYGPVGYAYFGLPSGCSSVDLGNLSCQPSTLGRFPVQVSALDSLGGRAAGTATVVVNALPTVASFVPSSSSVPAGGPVQLTTTVSGGTAPFQYQFSGLPSGCAWNGGAVVNCAGTPNGRFTVGVEVTDATGATTNGSTTFLVGPATGVGPVAPGSSGGLGSAFWWGLAVGAVLVGVAAIVGGNRLRLARQGEHIVQNLRESEALPMGASLGDDSTETPGPGRST